MPRKYDGASTRRSEGLPLGPEFRPRALCNLSCGFLFMQYQGDVTEPSPQRCLRRRVYECAIRAECFVTRCTFDRIRAAIGTATGSRSRLKKSIPIGLDNCHKRALRHLYCTSNDTNSPGPGQNLFITIDTARNLFKQNCDSA